MSYHDTPSNAPQTVGQGYYAPGGLEVVPQPPPIPKSFDQAPPSSRAFDQAPERYYSPAERTIFGVRRTTFFLSVALAIVIIAAAIGGGVGGSLAVQNAKSECASGSRLNGNSNSCQDNGVTITVTETTTATGSPSASNSPSSTTASLITVPTGLVPLECPGLGEDITITLGVQAWVFTPRCNHDYHGSDIVSVLAYSFHDCLQACASLNHYSGKDNCSAMTFNNNQTYSLKADYGNCFLKTGKPQGYDVQTSGGVLIAGALLKTSSNQSDR